MQTPPPLPTALTLANRKLKQPRHWRGTAYHEAGHAIAAVHGGIRRGIWSCLRTQMGEGGDTAYANKMLGHDQTRLAKAVAETKRFVDQHWVEIESVATALLTSTRLTEAQVVEIANRD
jgi:hypothetical protein